MELSIKSVRKARSRQALVIDVHLQKSNPSWKRESERERERRERASADYKLVTSLVQLVKVLRRGCLYHVLNEKILN